MLPTQNYLNREKNQWCVNPSLHMYSFTLQESDCMGRKGNCVKRSKIVPAVCLEFSGKNYFGNLDIKPIVVMTSKPGLSHRFSLTCHCLFFTSFVHFCEQAVFDFPIVSLRSHFHISAHTEVSTPLEDISFTVTF